MIILKTVAFCTLGCKVNQYETATLAALFMDRGYRVVDFDEEADVYVVNTCTVTKTADQKSRQLIRRAVRQNPDAVVVVTGCYAQVQSAAVSGIPGVDVVIGTKGRRGIVEMVEEAMRTGRQVVRVYDFGGECEFEELPAFFGTRTRAFLKIQEGCRDFCTYCVVPYARGPLRSRKPEAVIDEARRLLAAGFKELVLTGVNIGYYGVEFDPPVKLDKIISLILELPGLMRLRLSSIEPQDVTADLVSLLARERRFCPHLHIPVQSGDDEVLRLMGRRYDTGTYRKVVSLLREGVPNIAITTDVMVGFPGETESAFANTVSFVRDIGFAGLHVFKFSPRPGTPAAMLTGQLPEKEKERRLKVLLAVGAELKEAFANRFIGRVAEVLVERRNPDGSWEGLCGHYLRVVFKAKKMLVGSIVPVKVDAVKNDTLFGRPLLNQFGRIFV